MRISDREKNLIEKATIEIYFFFREYTGIFTSLSGFLRRKDASKMSRQINPSDDTRDNPYKEILEIHCGLAKYSPELEEIIWQRLECERGRFIKSDSRQKVELIDKIFEQFGKVVMLKMQNAPQADLEKVSFEFAQITQIFYEQIKSENH